jgi:hypothetical protein
MNIRLFIFFSFSVINSCFSQQFFYDSLKIKHFHNQSVIECLEYFSEDHYIISKRWLERMIIIEISKLSEEEILNSINIDNHRGRNKCNSKYDYNNFSIDNFNPLMYHLNFESQSVQIYYIPVINSYLKINPK